jgi:ankyrin repeat protein
LRRAIGIDDVEGVVDALRRGADANDPGDAGVTPLMTAYSARVAAALIEAGADVNARAADGACVLHYAVVAEQASSLVPLLLSHGAKPNVPAAGRDEETPLLAAKIWFFEGRDAAVGIGLMRLLASRGADVNAADRSGSTLLMTAAVNRKLALAKLMLELRADAARRSKDGHTALAYAEELGAHDIARLLRAAGVRS